MLDIGKLADVPGETDLAGAARLGRRLDHAVPEPLEAAAQGGQRGAQLVGDITDDQDPVRTQFHGAWCATCARAGGLGAHGAAAAHMIRGAIP
jgi:hypothetical protein